MYSLLYRKTGILCTLHVRYLLKLKKPHTCSRQTSHCMIFFKSRRRKSILTAIASAKFSPFSYNTCNIILFGERRRNNCLFFSKYRQVHNMHMNNQDRVFTDKNHAQMWLGNLLNFSSFCLLALTYHSNSRVVDKQNEACLLWVVEAPVTFEVNTTFLC